MTTTLENTLNLPSLDEINKLKTALSSANIMSDSEYADEMTEIVSQEINETKSEDDEFTQKKVFDLVEMKKYDEDVDTIFTEAMNAFKETMLILGDMPPANSGKIYESAAMFAKIALESKNSKMKARLDALETVLKGKKIEKKDKPDDNIKDVRGVVLDRNELLNAARKELEKKHK